MSKSKLKSVVDSRTTPPQPGLTPEAPKTLWEQPLKADFKSLFKALGKIVAHSLVGKKEDVLVDATEAATALGVTTPPEQLAWRLIERSLRRAVTALVAEAKDLFLTLEIKETTERLADRIDMAMVSKTQKISSDFFQRPGELTVTKWMQGTLTRWLAAQGLEQSKAEGLSARLPSYFTFSLHEEWRKNQTTYAPLRESLDSPFAKASQREDQWNLYSAWLDRQADQRMFDETFSVRQVYVALRAGYAKKKVRDRGTTSATFDANLPKECVVSLDECLKAWLEKWDGSDALRVISGGPGSGKSVFARLFAADVSRHGQCRVIYVPLHLYELKLDFITAVHAFCDGHEYLPKSVLDAKEGERKLLLIFDGLDELEKQGRMAAQVALDFVDEVSRTVDRLNQAEARVLVLVCGRPVAVQAGETVLRREEQVLHLLPYVLTDYEASAYEDPLKLLAIDQRDEWWKRYGECVGRAYDKLPETLKHTGFREITAQPLLNYLVALSHGRGKIAFTEGVNLNVIYHDLLDAVYERGYEKRPSRSVQGLELYKFVRVLEEIGLAAWHGDGRTTTVKKIEARCAKTSNILESLKQFAGDAEAGVSRLLTAFYFRQHGDVEGEKTFEFTHKTFGEFLTVCRIVREIRLLHNNITKRDMGDEAGFDEQQSLARWTDLCGPSEMTHELHRFLRREIAICSKAEARHWQLTCVRLIEYLLRHGMPMERLSPLPSFRELDRQSRNAEESLLALHNACAERTEKISQVSWPETTSFGAWHSRLSQQRQGPPNRIASASLSWLGVSGQRLDIKDLYGAYLTGLHAIGCNAHYATFTRAILNRANFSGADLGEANLREADLTNAVLRNANLSGADLRGADLRGADLSEADLRSADLTNAHLGGVILQGAKLERAKFSRSKSATLAVKGLAVDQDSSPDSKELDLSVPLPPRRRSRR